MAALLLETVQSHAIVNPLLARALREAHISMYDHFILLPGTTFPLNSFATQTSAISTTLLLIGKILNMADGRSSVPG